MIIWGSKEGHRRRLNLVLCVHRTLIHQPPSAWIYWIICKKRAWISKISSISFSSHRGSKIYAHLFWFHISNTLALYLQTVHCRLYLIIHSCHPSVITCTTWLLNWDLGWSVYYKTPCHEVQTIFHQSLECCVVWITHTNYTLCGNLEHSLFSNSLLQNVMHFWKKYINMEFFYIFMFFMFTFMSFSILPFMHLHKGNFIIVVHKFMWH